MLQDLIKERVAKLKVELEQSAACHNALYGRYCEAQHIFEEMENKHIAEDYHITEDNSE